MEERPDRHVVPWWRHTWIWVTASVAFVASVVTILNDGRNIVERFIGTPTPVAIIAQAETQVVAVATATTAAPTPAPVSPTATPFPEAEMGEIFFYAGDLDDTGSMRPLDVIPRGGNTANIAAAVPVTVTKPAVMEVTWHMTDMFSETVTGTLAVGRSFFVASPPDLSPAHSFVFTDGYVDVTMKVVGQAVQEKSRIWIGWRPTLWPVTIAEGIDGSGESWQPINPGTTFQEGIGELCAIFRYANIDDTSNPLIVWMHEGQEFNRSRLELELDPINVAGRSFFYSNCMFNTDRAPLPLGQWRAMLSVDGTNVEQDISFVIE